MRFFLALLLVSSSSMADWTYIVKNDGDVTFYLDFERIKKVNGNIQAWVLADFEKFVDSRQDFLSSVSLSEFDCKAGRTRNLQSSFYSGRMKGGDLTWTSNGSPWNYPLPDTTSELIMDFACGKRLPNHHK